MRGPLPAGEYLLVTSTFEPGQEGKFRPRLASPRLVRALAARAAHELGRLSGAPDGRAEA